MNPESPPPLPASSPFFASAIRPLEGDAETYRDTMNLLENMSGADDVPPGAREEAIARWDKLDQKKRFRFPVGMIVMAVVLALLAGIIFTPVILSAWRMRTIIAGLGTPAGPQTTEVGKPGLTREERLILYGDPSLPSKSARAKALWDSQPDNPVFFAPYVEAYLSENGGLPPDCLEISRRIDPRNAWFFQLAAGLEAKDAVKRKTQSAAEKAAKAPFQWDILDEPKLERSLAYLHDASSFPTSNNHKVELMRLRIPLMAGDTMLDGIKGMGYLASQTAADAISMRKVGDAIAAKASLLASRKDVAGFRALLADWEAFTRTTLEMDSMSLVEQLVTSVNASQSTRGLAAAAKELDLPEAERLQAIVDRLQAHRDARDKSKWLVDGQEFPRKSGLIHGLTFPMVARQALNPPPLSDADLKPGRLLDHEALSMISCLVAFFILAAGLAIASGHVFIQRQSVRFLAKRMTSLLRASDWIWIIAAGILLPAAYGLFINRLTPLGGRDFSLKSMVFILPAAQFIGMVFLMILAPISVARWRLGKRAAAFAFPPGSPPLAGWIVAALTLFIPLIGWMAVSGNAPSDYKALTLPFASPILLSALVLLSFSGKHRQPAYRAATARALVPPYACGMLLMLILAPLFASRVDFWFHRDHLLKIDAAYPSMNPYEYKVSTQLRKELKEAVFPTP